MSVFRGPRGCHQCGCLSFELHDWSTYVSVICTRCGAKQGELERQGRGSSHAVREIDEAFAGLRVLEDAYRRQFPEGRLGPPRTDDDHGPTEMGRGT